jgi:lipopolysaccharide export system permease protein
MKSRKSNAKATFFKLMNSLIFKLSPSLWHRHTFLRTASISLSILAALFFFYICLDASMNSTELKQLTGLKEWIFHYSYHFLKRLPLLLPFSLTLSTCHMMMKLQKQNELLSVSMSGASRLSILSAFFNLGFIFSLLVFMSVEGYFFPVVGLKSVHRPLERNLFSSSLFDNEEIYQAVPLNHKLNQWLIFRQYNNSTQTFYDVLWVENENQWWHFDTFTLIKKDELSIESAQLFSQQFPTSTACAIGHGVDSIQKQHGEKSRHWTGHFKEKTIQLAIDPNQLIQEARPAQDLSVKELLKALQGSYPKIQKPRLRAYLYFRLLQPFLCIFAPLVPFALCMHFRRSMAPFWIYSISASSLLVLFMILQSSLLLCSSTRADPFWFLLCPIIIAFTSVSFFIKRS